MTRWWMMSQLDEQHSSRRGETISEPRPGRPAEASRLGSTRSGLLIALGSAATFALSGPMGTALMTIGWSPAAAVGVRIGGAFLVLLIPCLVLLRRTGLPSRRQV